MKLTFKKLNVPNYVRTEQGTFALKDLENKEFNRYVKLWVREIKLNREKQLLESKK